MLIIACIITLVFFHKYNTPMSENVEKAGGNIDGILRFSIQWNDFLINNQNDLDAHCIEPDGNIIYYLNKKSDKTTARLDVDIIFPKNNLAIENITWEDKEKMQEGKYIFKIHNFSDRGGKDDFRAEVEADGKIRKFSSVKDLQHKEEVIIAEVMYSKKDGFVFSN